MQAKRSSFRLSWLNCCSDRARHCVRLHPVARFKPNLPGLPTDLPQPGEPTKLPKAQMLCCAPVIFNGTWSHFSAGNCSGGLETCALHSRGRILENCALFMTPHSKKEHPEKASNAREGSRKHLCEEGLRELGLFSLKKRRLRGALMALSQLPLRRV